MVSLLVLVCVVSCVYGHLASIEQIPACKIASSKDPMRRIVTIGDVHGSLLGLQEDLFFANVTTSLDSCEWRPEAVDTVVVQVGDIVDRGSQAIEAWRCLNKLQDSNVPDGSSIVRLVGNHELWWLEGHFHQKHSSDTREKVKWIVEDMKERILSTKIVASHAMQVRGEEVLFVHSGLRSAYLSYLERSLGSKTLTAQQISVHLNQLLARAVYECQSFACSLQDEAFEAGKDRGGSHIGGPFWTDYGVIEEDIQRGDPRLDSIVQIVGHTAAFCYSPRRPGVRPPDDVAECALGLVRSTPQLQAICVDGGMYMGARSFLDFRSDGHIVSWEQKGEHLAWTPLDLTERLCGSKLERKDEL